MIIQRFSNMDLRDNIKKATSLTFVDDNTRFYRLHGLSQAAKDKKMNERKVKKPRNLNLVENSDTNSSDDNDNIDIINSKVKPTFDKHEVSAAVREVNGGRDLSNKHWEEMYAKNLEEMIKCKEEISENDFTKHDNIKNRSEAKDLNDKCVEQKNTLYRNAAIMGLVKTKKIALQDLLFNENTSRKKNESETLHGTAFNECIMDSDKYQVESVPLREDPEIFVHPLQMGIDTKKFKDIDFTVSRIGKKKIVTPPGFFLEQNDDTFLEFVKPKIII